MFDEHKSRFTIRASRKEGSPRKFVLELSVGGLITVSVALVLGLVWVFILGVLLGRGYKPEQAVPEIARILPEQHQEREMATAPPRPQVLAPEELEYPRTVRQEPPTPETETPVQPPQPTERPEPATPPETVEPPKTAAQPEASAPEREEARYSFTYQVASFRKEEMAKALRQRLASQGIPASLESAEVKGDTWHRVMVVFKGTESEDRTIREKLASAGIKKPLLKGRKAL